METNIALKVIYRLGHVVFAFPHSCLMLYLLYDTPYRDLILLGVHGISKGTTNQAKCCILINYCIVSLATEIVLPYYCNVL